MRVALVCPFGSGPGRGNITTVRRIAAHLPEAGVRGELLPLDTLGPEEREAALLRAAPRLLHAFHAFHCGPVARLAAQRLGIPYLITITGSDLFDPHMRDAAVTRQAIAEAAAVTCFDVVVARRLRDLFPDLGARVAVVPQGVDPLPVVGEPFPRLPGEFLILLPAALRPVKGIMDALDGLTPLAMEYPSLRLLLAGGDLDPDYGRQVRSRAASLPWVRLLGDLPWQRMGGVYSAADLVLNSSLFEGGMANSLLEAMSMARPVLARDVPGNRSLVRHGVTGWLYADERELGEAIRRLLADPLGRRSVAEQGREYVLRRCSSRREVRRYAAVYRRILEGKK